MADQLDDGAGDVFRFSVQPDDDRPGTLRDFYREMLRDVLRIVRLFSSGRPIAVDAFAFLDEPDVQIPLADIPDPARHDRGSPGS